VQLSYALVEGERKRGLSIVKSRGSKHSSKLRELNFTNKGIAIVAP
jgi:hypothetical protein